MQLNRRMRLAILTLALAPFGAAEALAQVSAPDIIRPGSVPRRASTAINIPRQYQIEIEGKKVEKELGGGAPARNVTRVAEPMLSPDGKPLIAIVENRMLTKQQFEQRIGMVMNGMAPVESSDPEEKRHLADERRAQIENKVIEDWVHLSLLAVHAEHTGSKVTPQEIDAAIAELSSPAGAAGGAAGNPAGGNAAAPGALDGSAASAPVMQGPHSMVGVPEAELRQEVSDSLIVDKMVRQAVKDHYNEDQKKLLYSQNPQIFRVPESVHAWQLYMPYNRELTSKQQDEAYDTMNRWLKALKKCKDENDLAKLKNDLAQRADIVLRDMGYVDITAPFPKELLTPMFTMKVGQTSDMIKTGDLGMHAIRVVDHKKGTEAGFENAKPLIEAFCYDLMKNTISSWLQTDNIYPTSYNALGLVKLREVAKASPPPVAAPAGSAPAAATPPPMPGTAPATASAMPAVSIESLNLGTRSMQTPTGVVQRPIVNPPRALVAPPPSAVSTPVTIRPMYTPPPIDGMSRALQQRDK